MSLTLAARQAATSTARLPAAARLGAFFAGKRTLQVKLAG